MPKDERKVPSERAHGSEARIPAVVTEHHAKRL
jgi:hypothetical protein